VFSLSHYSWYRHTATMCHSSKATHLTRAPSSLLNPVRSASFRNVRHHTLSGASVAPALLTRVSAMFFLICVGNREYEIRISFRVYFLQVSWKLVNYFQNSSGEHTHTYTDTYTHNPQMSSAYLSCFKKWNRVLSWIRSSTQQTVQFAQQCTLLTQSHC
jgi:hypothetical protein